MEQKSNKESQDNNTKSANFDSDSLNCLSSLSNQKQLYSQYSGTEVDVNKMNLVGGHINQIEIESKDIIVKKTSYNEICQYQLIFEDNLESLKSLLPHQIANDPERMTQIWEQNLELRTFIPKLISYHVNQKDDRPEYWLKLENMMCGRENASIIDLKMGTSTITFNVKKSEKKMKKRILKDTETTTQMLGLRIIGYVVKSAQKNIEEKFYKFPYKQADEIQQVLRRILSFPAQEEKADQLIAKTVEIKVNQEAKQFVLDELQRLHEFLVKRSQRDIKGASLLILADHFTKSYAVKMIDLSTIDIYEDPSKRDEGLIHGVTNLIKYISQIE